jgi:hypothetical protein
MLWVRRFRAWLIGAVMVTVLFAVCGILNIFRYYGNDDPTILRTFMGYEGGEPASFVYYTNAVLSWMIYGLTKLFPSVEWFSILQLFVLWSSLIVIVKSLCQCAGRAGHPLWTGALASMVFIAAFGLYVSCRITYTTTAALCAAAAVAQLFSVDFSAANPRNVMRGITLSVVLLVVAFCLRSVTVWPSLFFWGLTLALKLIFCQKNRQRFSKCIRPVLIGTVCLLLTLGILALIEEIAISTYSAQEYRQWQNVRTQVMDYTNYTETTSDETLEKAGLSQVEFKLLAQWFFMDENINTQSLQAILNQQKADDQGLTVADRAYLSFYFVRLCLSRDATLRYAFWAILAMAIAAFFKAAILEKRRFWVCAGISLAVLGALLLLFLLGWQNRVLSRAIYTIIVPMAAFLFCAFFGFSFVAAKTSKRIAVIRHVLFVILVIPPLILCLWQTTRSATACIANIQQRLAVDDERSAHHIVLEAYAIKHPNLLLIYDYTINYDDRFFRDTSDGIPGNIVCWGGWESRSPSWYRQLSKYGISNLNATLFLHSNVRIVSLNAEPNTYFLQYLSEKMQRDIQWECTDTFETLYIFSFN